MLDLVVWERGAEPLGLGAVIRVATMPPCPPEHGRLASRDGEHAFRGGPVAHAVPFGFVLCRSLRCLSGLARACWGLVGIPLRLLRVPTKKFAWRLRSLCRLSERIKPSRSTYLLGAALLGSNTRPRPRLRDRAQPCRLRVRGQRLPWVRSTSPDMHPTRSCTRYATRRTRSRGPTPSPTRVMTLLLRLRSSSLTCADPLEAASP
jgi:hypothetical protein